MTIVDYEIYGEYYMNKSNDLKWDEKLNIKTNVFDYAEEDYQNYGYDPTPYVVLEELAKLDYLKEDDVLVDYGCGKGRVEFFLNCQVGCKTIGIDHSRRLLKKAEKNLVNYGICENIKFIHSKAEEYLPVEANRFYLFNPFSSKIFRQVLKRIEESREKNPREILIFFYYSTIEYKMYLPTEERLELIDSIDFNPDVIDDKVAAKLTVYKLK